MSSHSEQHIDEYLSGYIDNELTQQQRQRVEVHCAQCAQCQKELDELKQITQRVSSARLSSTDRDQWRESIDDLAVNVSRGIGWLLFLAGLLLVAGVMIYEVLFESSASIMVKVSVSVVYLGLGVLLLSVLRQRMIESKTDKYNDVEI